MNKDNAHKYLPFVQALVEGKTIQEKTVTLHAWDDLIDPHFDRKPENYRIKPEPRVIWLNEYPDQSIIWSEPQATKADADEAAERQRIRCVKFVECLE